MSRRTCVKCGARLAKPATGRPPRYCGVGCRRAAEIELRRLNAGLSFADAQIRRARRVLDDLKDDPIGDAAEELAWWRDERKRLEQRLAEILEAREEEE